jgi:RNA polymerase subunit RPABC4/transcription elongation factor Spt4
LKTVIEYRISEEHARSVFDRDEGKSIDETLRLIKLDVDDPRWSALGRIYSRHEGKGFYDWRIERRYSTAEIQDAKLHFFQIKTGVLPTGEECGTVYNDDEMCPLCGARRVQASPLRLRLTNMPKKAEVAQTWGGESLVSDRVVQLMIAAGITGFGLGPVQRSKKGDEEPFSLVKQNRARNC